MEIASGRLYIKIVYNPLEIFIYKNPSAVSSIVRDAQKYRYIILLYGFSKFSILIGWQEVRKKPYPDRGPYFPYLDRCPGCRLSGGKFLLCKQKNVCFLIFQLYVIKIYR
jgi:hypothetical protein